jgi:hypothetical protein
MTRRAARFAREKVLLLKSRGGMTGFSVERSRWMNRIHARMKTTSEVRTRGEVKPLTSPSVRKRTKPSTAKRIRNPPR